MKIIINYYRLFQFSSLKNINESKKFWLRCTSNQMGPKKRNELHMSVGPHHNTDKDHVKLASTKVTSKLRVAFPTTHPPTPHFLTLQWRILLSPPLHSDLTLLPLLRPWHWRGSSSQKSSPFFLMGATFASRGAAFSQFGPEFEVLGFVVRIRWVWRRRG